jgi:hypothetical protein
MSRLQQQPDEDRQEICQICSSEVANLEDHVWLRHVHALRCWCGAEWWPDPFLSHCDKHGGYFAHYLEYKLGFVDGG